LQGKNNFSNFVKRNNGPPKNDIEKILGFEELVIFCGGLEAIP
jgi:hypothetical protein